MTVNQDPTDNTLPGDDIAMYFTLPLRERPERELTTDSEEYVLRMINTGRLLVCYRTLGEGGQADEVLAGMGPAWDEPETYYDAITDILQAADYAGFDAAGLCRQAIDNQRSFKAAADTAKAVFTSRRRTP